MTRRGVDPRQRDDSVRRRCGDDDAWELSPQTARDVALCRANDLREHFNDDAPPEERVQA